MGKINLLKNYPKTSRDLIQRSKKKENIKKLQENLEEIFLMEIDLLVTGVLIIM